MKKILAPIEMESSCIFHAGLEWKAGIWTAEKARANRSKKNWHPF